MLARELMHEGCRCIDVDTTCREAARIMNDEAIGALPICSGDRLVGMLTDRDIVVRCLGLDMDPDTCTAGELATGRVIWAYEDTPVDDVLVQMEEHLIRRIPIMNRDKQLVGMISQGDFATRLGHEEVGELLEVVSDAPPRQSAAF
jgi:CBS domain-containing protein